MVRKPKKKENENLEKKLGEEYNPWVRRKDSNYDLEYNVDTGEGRRWVGGDRGYEYHRMEENPNDFTK